MPQNVAVDPLERSITRPAENWIIAWRPLLAATLTSLGYFFGATIGSAPTFQDPPVSTLWPPNSILLAALLLTPFRWWWLLVLAVLPAHLLIELHTGVPI